MTSRERGPSPPLSLSLSVSVSLSLSLSPPPVWMSRLLPPPPSSLLILLLLLSLSDLQLCSESWGKDAPLRLFFILIYLNLVFIVNQTVHTDPLGPTRSGPVRLGCAVERSGTMRLVVWRRSDGRRLNVNLQLLRAADSFPSFMRLLQAQIQTRTGLLSSILQTEAGGWGVEDEGWRSWWIIDVVRTKQQRKWFIYFRGQIWKTYLQLNPGDKNMTEILFIIQTPELLFLQSGVRMCCIWWFLALNVSCSVSWSELVLGPGLVLGPSLSWFWVLVWFWVPV